MDDQNHLDEIPLRKVVFDWGNSQSLIKATLALDIPTMRIEVDGALHRSVVDLLMTTVTHD